MEKEQRLTREKLIYRLIFATALILRLGQLGRVPLLEIEASWAVQAWELLNGGTGVAGHQVGYLAFTRIFFALFGGSDFTARLWPALVGSLIVWIPYYFRDQLGREAGLLAAFGLSIDPALVAVSRIAAGTMPALVFLCLVLGAFHKKDFRWGFSFLVLGLLSGPGFWMGGFLLIVSALLFSWLGVTDLGEYLRERAAILKEEAGSLDAAVRTFLVPAAIFLLVGSYLFTAPVGLSAWLGALPEFISRIFQASGIHPLQILVGLAISNPLSLVFGLLGFLTAWRTRDSLGIFSSVWFIVSLLTFSILPGRETADLIWLSLPLWFGAAGEMLRIYRAADNTWEVLGMGGLIVVLVILNWLTFIGMVYQAGNPRAFLLQIGLLLASVALVLISLVLMTGGSYRMTDRNRKDWGPAIKAVYLGMALVLLFFSISSLTQGSYIKKGDPRSIWTEGAGAGQYRLLSDSIYDASLTLYGRGKAIEGVALVDRADLRWALKDYPGIEFQETVGQDNFPPILITSDLDSALADQEIYRGQDFVAAVLKGWDGILPPDWISWIAFRSGDIENQDIILWIRNDIQSGY